jgi:hypothetical protein
MLSEAPARSPSGLSSGGPREGSALLRRPGSLLARSGAPSRVRCPVGPPADSELGRALGRLYASVPLPAQSEPEATHNPSSKLGHFSPPGGGCPRYQYTAIGTEKFNPREDCCRIFLAVWFPNSLAGRGVGIWEIKQLALRPRFSAHRRLWHEQRPSRLDGG